MNVASFGAGGQISFNQMDVGQASKVEANNQYQQAKAVIGNTSTSNGQAINSQSIEVLSDGTIKDIVLMYLLEDKDNNNKANLAKLMFANELYNVASNLQQGLSGGMNSITS